jgi:hypothetical protein
VPTETLTKPAPASLPPAASRAELELAKAMRRQAKRVRRLWIHAVAWAVGTIALTTLWIVNQWQAKGAFEHFGFEGNDGDWNPTLWALAVCLWTLAVGIMALRVRLERPPTETELEAEAGRLGQVLPAGADFRYRAYLRLERLGRLRFHIAAWALGMLLVTPLWTLIEWQDNGGFERWSDDGQRGSWELWILYVGGIWALVVVALAVRMYVQERRSG